MLKFPTLLAQAAVAALAFTAAASHAQDAATFPSKPITIVVTFPPGGAPDTLARIFSEKFQAAWGRPVIVENKPGAGGNIGADAVAKAAPDGHTIVVGTVGTHAINGAIYPKMPYDMVRDFTPISLVATTPNLLVVHPSVPAKNVKELIEWGKKEKGLTFASSGAGSSIHLSGELFKLMTGLDMSHIPYKGRAQAIPDLLAGRVTMKFDNMPSALPLVKEGRLRGLGVTSAKRSPAAPDIPTLAEQGLTGFDVSSWFALFAPAGTPKPIADKLAAETARVLKMPDVNKRLSELGLDVVGSTPAELADFQRREVVKWQKVAKESGARVD